MDEAFLFLLQEASHLQALILMGEEEAGRHRLVSCLHRIRWYHLPVSCESGNWKLETFALRPSLHPENIPGPFYSKGNSSEEMLLNVKLSSNCCWLSHDDLWQCIPSSLGQANRLVIPCVVLSIILKNGTCRLSDVQVSQVVTDLISTYSGRDNAPQSPFSDPSTQGMREEDVFSKD